MVQHEDLPYGRARPREASPPHKDLPPREPAFTFKTKDLRIAPRSKTTVGNFENLSGDWDGLVRGLKKEMDPDWRA